MYMTSEQAYWIKKQSNGGHIEYIGTQKQHTWHDGGHIGFPTQRIGHHVGIVIIM